MRNQRGFTLIEVVVVVFVLGVLAAIALPSFAGQRQSAFDGEAKAAARMAQGALEQLAVETGDFRISRDEVLEEAPELVGGPALALVTSRNAYAITVTAAGEGHSFAVQRTGAGNSAERTCTPAGAGGCGLSGRW